MATESPLLVDPGKLKLGDIEAIWRQPKRLSLTPESTQPIAASAECVAKVLDAGRVVYGVNTGFGKLANTTITRDQLGELQKRLVLSHCAGVGEPLPDHVVRLILAIKINGLARGHSGVRPEVINALLDLYNAEAYPVIPSQGSVGASGDLAPLAHLSAVLLGHGKVRIGGKEVSAKEALKRAKLTPMDLHAKEGLALLNGTQVSTALALDGLFSALDLFAAALTAGALSVDAALGSDTPFDPRIHALRGQPGQILSARILASLLAGSEIRSSHLECDRVQDPYSLRCQPQVMGAALDVMAAAAKTLVQEANAVSDNPLVFPDSGDVLSGGNFHAEPVAMAADMIALALAEMGAISERRVAMLTDASISSLPAFLIAEPGLNSGYMIAHVTAAALASENKSLAHPASVDSLPTSANQEDHVSMATHGARRLGQMAQNSRHIVGVELLAAAQGIDLRRPLKTSPRLSEAMSAIRERVAFLKDDRPLGPDITKIGALVAEGWFRTSFLDAHDLMAVDA